MSNTLFVELSKLLKSSPLVTLSIAREGPKLRVVITPKHADKLGEGETVEPHEAALVTPLTVTGTAEELDAGLIEELHRYLGAREQLVSAVADYEQELTAAKLGVKAKTAEHQKKRGVTPALSTPAAPPALPAPAVEAKPKPAPTAAASALAGA